MPSTRPAIDDTSTLREIQDYIWSMNIERGFDLKNPEKKMLLLTEEVGEVAKAVRKLSGMKFTASTKRTDLAEEIADVFIVLTGLASLTGVDLTSALLEKEKKNTKRTWQ